MSFIATVLYVPNTLDLFPLKCRALSFFKAFIHTRSVPSLGMYGRFSTCHPYNIQLFLSLHLFLCLNNTSSRRCFPVLRTKPVPLIILSWSILHFLYQYSQCICTYSAIFSTKDSKGHTCRKHVCLIYTCIFSFSTPWLPQIGRRDTDKYLLN